MKWTDIGAVCAAVVFGIAICGVPAYAQQQRTAKECNQEWKANKASIKASGKTKKAFVAECRGQTAAAAPTQQMPAPAPTYSQQPAPTYSQQPAMQPRTTARSRQTTSPIGGAQFATEVEAKAHCPNDTVVWANLGSKIYHFSGTRDYGRTKRGAYMCERETAGFRAAKNEKHP
jgi:hypothetical protein